MSENEVAAVLDIQSLCDPDAIDCHSWLPVEVAGAELDFCAVCSMAGAISVAAATVNRIEPVHLESDSRW